MQCGCFKRKNYRYHERNSRQLLCSFRGVWLEANIHWETSCHNRFRKRLWPLLSWKTVSQSFPFVILCLFLKKQTRAYVALLGLHSVGAWKVFMLHRFWQGNSAWPLWGLLRSWLPCCRFATCMSGCFQPPKAKLSKGNPSLGLLRKCSLQSKYMTQHPWLKCTVLCTK